MTSARDYCSPYMEIYCQIMILTSITYPRVRLFEP